MGTFGRLFGYMSRHRLRMTVVFLGIVLVTALNLVGPWIMKAMIDAYTELLIQKALGRILSERTSIVIAQRPSTIRNANRIVVIDKGRIMQEGSHDELIEAGGLYAHLYEMQFSELIPAKI